MTEKDITETIESDWDRFYRDFPEIYDEFGRVPKTPTAVQVVQQHFPMQGKTVLDVGSGTGLSTFELAQYTAQVTGVEPEDAMREVAEREAERLGIGNVSFIHGWAEKLPLPDKSVDMVTAITLASLYTEENILGFIRESERVVKPGGVVLTVDLASRWYGGELAEVILEKPRAEMEDELRDLLFPRFGYSLIEFYADQDYGTVEKAVRTYGFIFGKNAIEYIRQHNKTIIRWKINMHYKVIERR